MLYRETAKGCNPLETNELYERVIIQETLQKEVNTSLLAQSLVNDGLKLSKRLSAFKFLAIDKESGRGSHS